MPPKRRRTTTALSTAVDSLRAKIRNFADTADEEQLREVAQLIDRLSISNNGPFRLLDLPYELLEYTAERYFTRGEAAPILPVNRVFNELFANRVWKNIGFDGIMVDECEVPQDALMKNTRRIQVLDLEFIRPDFFVSGYFHYATSIAFELKDDMEKMFTLHLEQMKYLRHVILTVIDMPSSVVDTAAKWIDDSRRSGHVQQIVINAVYSSDRHQSNHILASLMDKIKFKKRIRLKCTSVQPFPTSIVQYMPTTLTYLNIAEDIQRRCYSEVNKQVFGTYPDSVFLHLQTLFVQVCCSKSSLYSFQSFIPERFPVLKSLTMSITMQSRNRDANIPFVTIFSNMQWPSITSLEFAGKDMMVSNVGRVLSKAMPALHDCTFRDIYELTISPGLGTCLTISRLTLVGTFLETSHLRGKFAYLVYLELDYIFMDSNHLQFIASCKRLVEINLTDCEFMKDAIVAVYKYPCNSVRKVVISVGSGDLITEELAHLLLAFPNLRVLDLTGRNDEETRMSFILKCPTVKIIT